MRAVLQRVQEASVEIHGQITARIGPGLLILLGVESRDDGRDISWLAGKVARLRLFGDQEGNMNLSLAEIGGESLVVSQFTLFASTKKGNRPSHIRAARPEQAIPLYEAFVAALTDETQRPVRTGTFGADMQVRLINDGPVTVLLDTLNRE